MAVRQTPTHAHTRKTDHAVLRRISITSAGDVAYRQQLFLRDKLQTTAISDRHTARRGTRLYLSVFTVNCFTVAL